MSDERERRRDGGQPEECDTLGCENTLVEGAQGYCTECVDISPGILDSDDRDEALAEEHRASAVSRGGDEPEREHGESAASASHSPVEAGFGDAIPGFEPGASDARGGGTR